MVVPFASLRPGRILTVRIEARRKLVEHVIDIDELDLSTRRFDDWNEVGSERIAGVKDDQIGSVAVIEMCVELDDPLQ